MLNKGRRIIAALCTFAILLSAFVVGLLPVETFAATSAEGPVLDLEEDVKYFGRTFAENGVRYFSWSNSGFQFSFYGTGATATLKSTQHTAGSATETAYVKIYVDGAFYKDVAVPETETAVTLASGLTNGQHTIKVVKRTSGYYSIVGLSKIQLDAGSEIRQTQKHYERNMLFIGDDLMTGYGSMVTKANVTGKTVPKYSTATEDSTITYTALTADYFGAENMTIALSGSKGRGIVKNGGGSTSHTAPKYFEYLEYREKRSVAYDHTQYDPDVVVINLGTYDQTAAVSAADFKIGCKSFIQQVRAAYPEATIIYAYGFGGTTYASTIQTVIKELNNAGDQNLYYTALSAVSSSEKGVDDRPTKEAHAARSKQLIAAVEKHMGWTGANTEGNPVASGIDTGYEPMEPVDITTMSYNVLAHNNSSQTYEDYSTRMAKVVTMIRAYDPDVIGLQEVARKSTNYSHDWPGYLSGNLSEYACVRLDTQANNTSLMTIASGLMIMYKKDRFTLVSSGCKQFVSNATVDGKTDKDTDRWFQWVQLKDNQTGAVFYFYNTHLSIDPTNSNYTSAQKAAMGHIHRTNECQTLATHIASTTKATKCPFFIAGDFNTSFETSDQYLGKDSTKESLYKLVNYTKGTTVYDFFRDAAQIAPYTRFSDTGGTIDHIFVNSRYVDVKEVHVAAEGVNGRRTSDHSPLIVHCNFKANSQISGMDTSNREFTASASANKYTFNISVGTGVTYDVYDGATKVGTGSKDAKVTVTLDQAVNRFSIHFKDGYGNPTCKVTAVITRTSIAQPTVKATGSVVNQYYANGAYHVLVNGDKLDITTSSGSFYTNPYASRGAATTLTLAAIPAGRSVYYLKSSVGDVYPVYIYKQTAQASANPSALYLDDDIGGATGTVAFYDGSDVIFATGGTNGFGTVAAAAAKANTIDGATVYFAPGYYSVNTQTNDVVFSRSVTLLGNNHDVSAVAVQGKDWSLAGRKAETVIDGGFVFESADSISVTVKGFTIEGVSTKGPIYVNDTTSSNSTRAKHTQTLDIQNNILTGGGNGLGTSPAVVHAYSGAMVAGVIQNNYFRCTVNQFGNTNGYTRGTLIKNANGLTLEGNYFIGYEVVNLFNGHISDSVAGYCKYTVEGNRFEHCGASKNFIKGITADTSAHVVYNKNDFVRCGGVGNDGYYAVTFDFNENKLHNDCANIKVSVLRNNFYDCYRSLCFEREATTGQTGDLGQMQLKIKSNSFIQPTEGKWSKYFHSIRFSFLVDSTYTHNVRVSDTQWDFAGNTFKSAFLDAETLSGENTTTPAFNYVYNSVTYGGVSDSCFELTPEHFN